MKKALVISGGGSKGAFAGGISQYLINDLKKEYNYFIGTSTGALVTSLVSVNEIEKLKQAYTTISQKDIFSINPLNVQEIKPDGDIKSTLNFINVFYNIIIKKKKTLGDSSALRKTINNFFTKEMFDRLCKTDKELYCCVSNVTLGKKEFKSNKSFSYEEFCDWIYISACAPPFLSLNEKNDCDYTDGGVFDNVPIQEAIDLGAKEVDVIVLTPENGEYKKERIKNIAHWILKLNSMLQLENYIDNMEISKLRANDEDVNLNIYYVPRVLTNNALVFDNNLMSGWWKEGYEYAKKEQNIKKISILTTKNKKSCYL